MSKLMKALILMSNAFGKIYLRDTRPNPEMDKLVREALQ